MKFTELRKLDYIAFYIFISVTFIVQLMELSLFTVIGILGFTLIPALILGTITNMIFRKNK